MLVGTSSQIGEDVIVSGELGAVVRDFISSIFKLGFCDEIVLGFFGVAMLPSLELYELY